MNFPRVWVLYTRSDDIRASWASNEHLSSWNTNLTVGFGCMKERKEESREERVEKRRGSKNGAIENAILEKGSYIVNSPAANRSQVTPPITVSKPHCTEAKHVWRCAWANTTLWQRAHAWEDVNACPRVHIHTPSTQAWYEGHMRDKPPPPKTPKVCHEPCQAELPLGYQSVGER